MATLPRSPNRQTKGRRIPGKPKDKQRHRSPQRPRTAPRTGTCRTDPTRNSALSGMAKSAQPRISPRMQTQTASSSHSKNLDIEVLRAIAILGTMVSHLDILFFGEAAESTRSSGHSSSGAESIYSSAFQATSSRGTCCAPFLLDGKAGLERSRFHSGFDVPGAFFLQPGSG